MKHGKGVIGYASHYLGRYREFDQCLAQLKYPEGSIVDPQIGLCIPLNFNNMIRTMLIADFEWLWILGDDHVFHPNTLMTLLNHDVDAVLPLCMTRGMIPHKFVVFEGKENGYSQVESDFFDGKSGLVDITDYPAGNAGLLIKRRVAEEIDAPWYENDRDNTELGRCDLVFATKMKHNGFKIYIDTDTPLGHITHMAVWPRRDKEMIYTSAVEPIPVSNYLSRKYEKEMKEHG